MNKPPAASNPPPGTPGMAPRHSPRVPRVHRAGPPAVKEASRAVPVAAVPLPKKPQAPPIQARPRVPTAPPIVPPAPPAPPAAASEPPKSVMSKGRKKFVVISIIGHVVFLLAAWYLVVQTTTDRKLTFKGVVVPPSESRKNIEHAVQLAQKRDTMSAPTQPKRVTTTGVSRTALPDLALTPDVDSPLLSDTQGLGMPGHGAALGLGAVGNSSALGQQAAQPFFGVTSPSGGIVGTFYDLKRDRSDRPTIVNSRGAYGTFLQKFLKGSWQIPPEYKYWKSPTKLYSRQFFFPAISDTEAGKAFDAPETGPGSWIAHYKGKVSVAADGTYRLVGFGDNLMNVKLGGIQVLDASDHGYSGAPREVPVGGAKFPGKSYTPIFVGEWFTLQKGETKPLEVLLGDEGGIFCAGLFVQAKGTDLKLGPSGIPELPLFTIGAISDAGKAALRKFLPDSALSGSPFLPEQNPLGGLPPISSP